MGRTSDARERLLDSAGQLIHERGYHAVGIAEICGSAGVHKGSFYHFFASKQQLVLELIDGYWLGMRDQLDAMVDERSEVGPLERLGIYLGAVATSHRKARTATGRQAGCPLANLALEMSLHDVELRERLRRAFEAQIGYFERLLEQAQAAGDLRQSPDARRRAATSILALIQGRLMLAKLHQDLQPLDELVDAVGQLLGRDLAAIPAAT